MRDPNLNKGYAFTNYAERIHLVSNQWGGHRDRDLEVGEPLAFPKILVKA
jgi:hypothetical protein